MKTLLIAVFVSGIAVTLPVKAELLRLGAHGNCAIYKEINEFNDELRGYHFTCGHDLVLMSLRCNKKEKNSRIWALLFNGSSRIIPFADTEMSYVAGKIRIGKQPAIDFQEARVYTSTSRGGPFF